MVKENAPEIKVDPVLHRLVQPLGNKELVSLREDLIQNPSSRTIQTWNGYLLHDYDKYDLCRSLRLPLQIDDKSFLSYEHAAADLCMAQMNSAVKIASIMRR